MTTGKGFAAGDFLSAGLRRSDDTVTSTHEQVADNVSPSTREPAPPVPVRERYGRATYYLRPDQIAWAKSAAKEIASDGSVSASDIARVGMDLAAGLSPAELRQRVVERAEVEGLTFPGRHNRGMPARLKYS
jgi:hypothetical protein